jgi:hypothetical protein
LFLKPAEELPAHFYVLQSSRGKLVNLTHARDKKNEGFSKDELTELLEEVKVNFNMELARRKGKTSTVSKVPEIRGGGARGHEGGARLLLPTACRSCVSCR